MIGIFLAIASSWLVFIIAASLSAPWVSFVGAAFGAAVAVFTSLRLNGYVQRGVTADERLVDPDGRAGVERARQNALLIAATFAWGAGAIGLGYGLTPLHWQHWWQYAAAFGVLAGLAILYSLQLATSGSPLAMPKWLDRSALLTAALAVAAFIGVGFLLVSGKLFVNKPDWLANHVFLFGGLAITFLAALAAAAHRRGE
ncbi:MAG: hypothetical protein ACFCUN_07175 [Hyphomicrobiaceae bacterium]